MFGGPGAVYQFEGDLQGQPVVPLPQIARRRKVRDPEPETAAPPPAPAATPYYPSDVDPKPMSPLFRRMKVRDWEPETQAILRFPTPGFEYASPSVPLPPLLKRRKVPDWDVATQPILVLPMGWDYGSPSLPTPPALKRRKVPDWDAVVMPLLAMPFPGDYQMPVFPLRAKVVRRHQAVEAGGTTVPMPWSQFVTPDALPMVRVLKKLGPEVHPEEWPISVPPPAQVFWIQPDDTTKTRVLSKLRVPDWEDASQVELVWPPQMDYDVSPPTPRPRIVKRYVPTEAGGTTVFTQAATQFALDVDYPPMRSKLVKRHVPTESGGTAIILPPAPPLWWWEDDRNVHKMRRTVATYPQQVFTGGGAAPPTPLLYLDLAPDAPRLQRKVLRTGQTVFAGGGAGFQPFAWVQTEEDEHPGLIMRPLAKRAKIEDRQAWELVKTAAIALNYYDFVAQTLTTRRFIRQVDDATYQEAQYLPAPYVVLSPELLLLVGVGP